MNQKQLRARNQYAMVRAEVWNSRRRFQDHEVRLAHLEQEVLDWRESKTEMQTTINMAYRHVLGSACIHPLSIEEQMELGRRLASQFKAIPELRHLPAA